MAFRPTIMGTHGMVATEHYLSAFIGATILRQGGNAVDAAVAAIFAEGVVNPHMHTLGGEVPMLISSAATGQVVALNGNTAAPQRATIDWFTQRGMTLIPGEGLLAAGVPAACDALLTALERFGTMTSQRCCNRPRLASAGFPVHPGLRGPSDYLPFSIWHNQDKFREQWPTSAQLYMPQGRLPEVGRCGAIPTWPGPSRSWRRSAAASQGRTAGLQAARRCFIVVQSPSTSWRFRSAMEAFSNSMTWRRVSHQGRDAGLCPLPGLRGVQMRSVEPGASFFTATSPARRLRLRALGHNSAAYIHTVTEVSNWPLRTARLTTATPICARAAARAALRHLHCGTPPIDRS